MTVFELLFGLRGRVNRIQYWSGHVLVALGGVTLAYLLAYFMSTTMPQAARHSGQAGLAGAALVILAVGILIAWCELALHWKRFQDRGRPGWLSLAPAALVVLSVVALVTAKAAGIASENLKMLEGLFLGALALVGVWFLIELGCLPGSQGSNAHGDPSGGRPAKPPTARSCTPTPAAFGRR